MYDLPKPILRQLLSVKNTHPERLSEHEAQIAARICFCTSCDNIWIRRKQRLPDRCPACHSRSWDRPLLSALIGAQEKATTPTTDGQPKKEGQ